MGFTGEQRTKLIKVLTKRMDDSSNTIRLAILPSVAVFFSTMPSTFSDSEVSAFVSHTEAVDSLSNEYNVVTFYHQIEQMITVPKKSYTTEPLVLKVEVIWVRCRELWRDLWVQEPDQVSEISFLSLRMTF